MAATKPAACLFSFPFKQLSTQQSSTPKLGFGVAATTPSASLVAAQFASISLNSRQAGPT